MIDLTSSEIFRNNNVILARNAADLIAYAHSHTDEHGSIPKEVRQELRRNIQQWLGTEDYVMILIMIT